MNAPRLRTRPEIRALFKNAEGRQFTEEELATYRELVEDGDRRAQAAVAIAAIEQDIVNQTVRDIFAVYPFEANHELAQAKATRDIRMVSTYATHAMLLDDTEWFDAKLLIWLQTILQAFGFPDKKSARKVLFGKKGGDDRLARASEHVRPIYATYVALRDLYRKNLDAEDFELLRPALQRAIDTLSWEVKA